MRFLSLCLISALIFAPVARACGDKLVPLGGGISFARISEDQPVGSIVIFVDAGQLDQHRRSITSLRKALERAGHQVLVTSDPAELRAVMQTSALDLVLTSVSAAGSDPWAAPQPAVAPVVLRMNYGSPIEADSTVPGGPGACTVEAGKRTSRGVARTVSEILRQRSEGIPMECVGTS